MDQDCPRRVRKIALVQRGLKSRKAADYEEKYRGSLQIAEPSKTRVGPGERVSGNGVYLPGELFVYDSRSGQSYTLDAGQADSEPLVVEGDTLYCRVHNSLYTVTIRAGSLQSPTLIATDPVLSEAHWAFFGQ